MPCAFSVSGFLYDVTFSLYFSIFFAVFLLVLPNKAYTSRVFKGLCHLSFFVFLYALYFTQVAEWLFWDEFSTRFNFIAVDYLVYGTEVTHNIYESYPVALSSGRDPCRLPDHPLRGKESPDGPFAYPGKFSKKAVHHVVHPAGVPCLVLFRRAIPPGFFCEQLRKGAGLQWALSTGRRFQEQHPGL